eukprot:TRINITY_DN33681_c0_g1_i1.p1 TRINITY_DN33681_c0_g1~~TRINITY_DN33681_c0_g1_i1.p1  ORF type:complete len:239 (+),score=50.62 TRINITY_DN33681_c0_g1_i1:49-765(+)
MMRELVPKVGTWAYKKSGESVLEFVTRLPPSRTSNTVTPWICAHYQHEMWEPPPVHPKLEQEFNKKVPVELLQRDAAREVHQVDMAAITPLFTKHNYTLGKWILMAERDEVDDLWERVCVALYTTGLGCGVAKVSPATPESDVHVIAIYSLDFTRTWDVKRVARQIRTELNITSQLKYKPEAATQLDLYCENERWGPRPTTIYVNIRNRTNTSIPRRAWDIRRSYIHDLLEEGVFRQL